MKIYFLWVLFLIQNVCATNDISFFRNPFNEFLARYVEPEDITPFKIYYENFILQQKKMKKKALEKKRLYLDSARDKFERDGWASLQIKYPALAVDLSQLKTCANESEKQILRRFVVRHGIYEEFLQKKARNQYGTFAKMRRFGRDIGDSVVSFVNSWRSPRAI